LTGTLRVAHKVDEALAAAWYAEVDISHGLQHLARGLVSGGQQGHDVGVDVHLCQHAVYEVDACLTGVDGVASALQDAGVAALDTQGKHVEGHVGAGFVDHADDTEGHTNALEVKAVVKYPMLEHMPQRRGQRGHLPHGVGNLGEPGLGQLQSVVHRVFLVHAVKVLLVGYQQGWHLFDDGIGHPVENLVPCSTLSSASTLLAFFTRLKMFSKAIFLFHIHIVIMYERLHVVGADAHRVASSELYPLRAHGHQIALVVHDADDVALLTLPRWRSRPPAAGSRPCRRAMPPLPAVDMNTPFGKALAMGKSIS
jgi:hypothetical protein